MKKLTRHRQVILDNMLTRRDHPTAKMVYDSIRIQLNKLSFATVYNSLEYLSKNGMIRKMETFSDSARYDAVMENHMHLLCKKCGEMFDSPPIDLSSVLNFSEEDFKIEEISITIQGICKNCMTR